MSASDDRATMVSLRSVQDGDLDVLFRHQADAQAAAMAAFPSRDREQFDAHWARLRADDRLVTRAVLVDGEVAGNIGCWPNDGVHLLGYWIGREFWGLGVATRALALFLEEVPDRPLLALVAEHNVASVRVLEKNGFRRDPEAESPEHDDGVRELAFRLGR